MSIGAATGPGLVFNRHWIAHDAWRRPIVCAILLLVVLLPGLAFAQVGDAGTGSGASRSGSGGNSESSSDRYFSVDALNAGLGEAPSSLDRETPQSALESFLFTTESGDYDAAAHLLNLSGIPAESQAVDGPRLAARLKAVIDRKLWIDWGALPDRPDGLDAFTTQSPMAGEPRRSLRLEILDLDNRTVSIRLNRVRAEGGDPVWVFSEQTVDNIDALYARYGPTALEARLPHVLRSEAAFGLQGWELIALPVMFLLAGLIALIVYRLLRHAAGWIARPVLCRSLQKAALPLALFVAVLAARLTTARFFTFSAPVDTFLQPAFLAGLIFAVAVAILRAVDAFLDVITDRYVGNIDDEENTQTRELYTNIYAFRRVVVLIAFLLGVAILLLQLDLFESLGMSILASAGVLSIIIGLAAQTVLGNIMSSLQIAIAKPIRIGDSVYYEGQWSYIESIFYTYVQIRTWDNRRLIVPVKYFVSNPFENWTKEDSMMVRPVELKLDHRADVEDLRRHWEGLVRADEDSLDDEWIKTLVIDQDEDGMTVRFYVSAKDPTTAWNLHCRLREKILAYIRDKGEVADLPRERVVSLTPDGSGHDAALGSVAS